MAYDGRIAPPDALQGDIGKVLAGWRLTTASILYHMPDHPKLLQEFIWQELDEVPRFPTLKRFLTYWQRELDGKLYRVRIAFVDKVAPSDWRKIEEELIV